jgi:hypothetical protein
MQNQINTTPISIFIQSVRSAEQTGAKLVSMDLTKARMLALALTEVLEKQNRDYETMFNQLKNSMGTEVISVEFDGGGFDDSK